METKFEKRRELRSASFNWFSPPNLTPCDSPEPPDPPDLPDPPDGAFLSHLLVSFHLLWSFSAALPFLHASPLSSDRCRTVVMDQTFSFLLMGQNTVQIFRSLLVQSYFGEGFLNMYNATVYFLELDYISGEGVLTIVKVNAAAFQLSYNSGSLSACSFREISFSFVEEQTLSHRSMNGDITFVSYGQTSKPSVIKIYNLISWVRGFTATGALFLLTGTIAGVISRSTSNSAFMKLLSMIFLWKRSFFLASYFKERIVLSQCFSLCGRLFPLGIPGIHSNSFTIFLVCEFYGLKVTMRSVLMTIFGIKGWFLTSRYNVTRLLCSGLTVMLPSTHLSQVLNPMSCSSENLSKFTSMFFNVYCLCQRGCLIPYLYCCNLQT